MAISLRNYQEDAVRAVRQCWRKGEKRVLVSFPTGTGKCATPDTHVWSGGLRTFGELRDEGAAEILTPAGMRVIEGWHDDGVREGLKVTCDCGFEIDGTGDHRIWVRDAEGREDWKRLTDLDGTEDVAVALGHADWGDVRWGSEQGVEGYGKGWFWRVVPKGIMLAPRSTVKAFLRGAFGVLESLEAPERVVACTRLAARQVQALLLGLGIVAAIEETRPGSPLPYTLSVNGSMRALDAGSPVEPPGVLWDTIRTVKPSTIARIDCEVRDEHCYIGNGIINHNTWLFVFIIYAARENGLRCLVLVNTDELVQQTVEKLERVGVNVGIMKAGKNEWTRDVVVASVQTLSKPTRLFNLPPNHFGLVITDECHYANAPSYQRVLWYFRDAWHLGVTATPFRGDKQSLAGAGWDTVAYVYPLKRAIEEKWLCPVKFVTVHTGVEIKGVGMTKASITSEKDFNLKALEKVINTPERNEKIVEASIKHLVVRDGAFKTRFRRTIAFCASVAHTVDLANAFRKRGVEAFAIYGSMKTKHRRLVIEAHQKGLFPMLCNCNILTHGYDDPHVDGLIMARPTSSKVLYMQALGRGLRIEDNKEDCVCLDVADVSTKHSLTIGSELVELEEALDERGEAVEPAGLVPGRPTA